MGLIERSSLGHRGLADVLNSSTEKHLSIVGIRCRAMFRQRFDPGGRREFNEERPHEALPEIIRVDNGEAVTVLVIRPPRTSSLLSSETLALPTWPPLIWTNALPDPLASPVT